MGAEPGTMAASSQPRWTATRSAASPPRTRAARRRIDPAERARRRKSARLRRQLSAVAFAALLTTWGPGLVGALGGGAAFRWWGALAGYLGLSWALPAVVIGVIVNETAKMRGRRGHRARGIIAGLIVGAALLTLAAALIGS